MVCRARARCNKSAKSDLIFFVFSALAPIVHLNERQRLCQSHFENSCIFCRINCLYLCTDTTLASCRYASRNSISSFLFVFFCLFAICDRSPKCRRIKNVFIRRFWHRNKLIACAIMTPTPTTNISHLINGTHTNPNFPLGKGHCICCATAFYRPELRWRCVRAQRAPTNEFR